MEEENNPQDINTENNQKENKVETDKKNNEEWIIPTPEAVIMFSLAGILDLMGLADLIDLLIPIGIGNFISYISDILGLVIIGAWMLIRSGSITNIKKKSISRVTKFLPAVEFIPYIGNLPCWTLVVFMELKSQN